MKDNPITYKELIERFKNSEIEWIRELWEETEKYFNKKVLSLLVFHPLTEDDKAYILFSGFENVFALERANRSTNFSTNNDSLLSFFYRANYQGKITEKTPLDKTDIDSKLFRTFNGFSFIAVKDKYFLEEIYYKKKENSELTEKNKNFKTALADYEIDRRNLNNEISIAHNKLKNRANRGKKEKNSSIRYTDLIREKTFENELRRIADTTRKKNGKLNYSKIASIIDGNICHHTIKKWCENFKIPIESPYLTH